jgi:hypothetical protein
VTVDLPGGIELLQRVAIDDASTPEIFVGSSIIAFLGLSSKTPAHVPFRA